MAKTPQDGSIVGNTKNPGKFGPVDPRDTRTARTAGPDIGRFEKFPSAQEPLARAGLPNKNRFFTNSSKRT